MKNIISVDEKNWVKTYGFDKVSQFVVDLSKLPTATATLVITRQQLLHRQKIQETKYEISVSTIPNLFTAYSFP